VLAHNQVDTSVPAGQQCCGALHVHSGTMDGARKLARTNIEAFEGDGESPIIVTAAGCGAALKEYGFLLKDDPEYAERAERFSARVQDVTEYLASRDLVPPTHPVDGTVTYQEPCHLAHAQRITAQPRSLLAQVPGLELVEMRESSLCCGSAGIYNIIRKDMADDLGDRKVATSSAAAPRPSSPPTPGATCSCAPRSGETASTCRSATSSKSSTKRTAAPRSAPTRSIRRNHRP
jgi:glycolate oxidase iron-sulfur subunit